VDETYLTFSVWNAGVAIPVSIIGKLFEPFWQPSGTAAHQGLGRGLNICSQIAQTHENL
jgi:signal transduction histidine kinase